MPNTTSSSPDSAKAVLKMHGDALDYERKREHTRVRKLYETWRRKARGGREEGGREGRVEAGPGASEDIAAEILKRAFVMN